MRKTGVRHYWRKALAVPERTVCDAPATLAMVSREPQPALGWLSRLLAFLTTPFKRLGISGWKETGCAAEGRGWPVRAAQHSTDGFWTIDVELVALAAGGLPADLSTPAFLRLEVEPGTAAHEVCASIPIGPAIFLEFGGPIVIDQDGPFLEVHPDRNFQVTTAPEKDGTRIRA